MKLRLWPAAALAVLIPLVRFAMPAVFPETVVFGIFGGLVGALAVGIWWAFFSKASKAERWGAIILMVVSLAATAQFIDISIATGGQGSMFYLFAIPILCCAFAVWALLTQYLSNKIRRWTMAATIILASGIWTLFRIDGITGEFGLDLAWRWAPTPEEQLLSNHSEILTTSVSTSIPLNTNTIWPGFRGPERNSIVRATRISTDWRANPPHELRRRPVGPGCGSFAVHGALLYTQEQRGEDEAISCYNIKSGELIWMHTYKARFWDSHAGAGPRSTPTYYEGSLYTLGATGMVNALDAQTGNILWSRNAVADTNQKHSGWGYSSSPLVVNNHVIVAVVGQLIAYDIHTGNINWTGPARGDSYSSPHLATIDGLEQVILMSGDGATSVSPSDGSLLWDYSWPGESRIVQPCLLGNGDLLIGDPAAQSMRCISVVHQGEEWIFKELWTSTDIKPNFNDFVVHNGYVYGYTGPMLVCVDTRDGKRQWRGGRYGGQILLLDDQDLLLILSEKGDIALVNASPERFRELAEMQAIEGKTWNHPVLAGDILLVRNSQEMAAFYVGDKNL